MLGHSTEFFTCLISFHHKKNKDKNAAGKQKWVYLEAIKVKEKPPEKAHKGLCGNTGNSQTYIYPYSQKGSPKVI